MILTDDNTMKEEVSILEKFSMLKIVTDNGMVDIFKIKLFFISKIDLPIILK